APSAYIVHFLAIFTLFVSFYVEPPGYHIIEDSLTSPALQTETKSEFKQSGNDRNKSECCTAQNAAFWSLHAV
ncbi:hypothetical protein LINPERHAP2_LOCUS2899, partial [Linum perenne]